MAHQHPTTCASCFTEIEYGAICNCTDFNEVNDQFAQVFEDSLDIDDTVDLFGDEDDDTAYLRDEEYYDRYDRYDYY